METGEFLQKVIINTVNSQLSFILRWKHPQNEKINVRIKKFIVSDTPMYEHSENNFSVAMVTQKKRGFLALFWSTPVKKPQYWTVKTR